MIACTGSPSVQESTSSWVFSSTSVSMVSLLHTSRRCLFWNQLFRPSPAFARRREAIFLCREQKQKRLGHDASPLLGSHSGTNCLTTWGTLPWVYLFSNKNWNRICLNNVDVRYSLNWQNSPKICVSVNAFAFFCEVTSKEVTFTLHYFTLHYITERESVRKRERERERERGNEPETAWM